jgi:hypothetical protein
LPDHHDAIWGSWLANGLSPLFTKIRDQLQVRSTLSRYTVLRYASAQAAVTRRILRGRHVELKGDNQLATATG